jgi:hypothetical protein
MFKKSHMGLETWLLMLMYALACLEVATGLAASYLRQILIHRVLTLELTGALPPEMPRTFGARRAIYCVHEAAQAPRMIHTTIDGCNFGSDGYVAQEG